MTAEIRLLLQQGWANLWKNKFLWVFSSLVLIDPLVRLLVPISKYDDLPSALSYLVLNLFFAYLSFMSAIGISVVAYCIAIGKPVNIKTAFRSSTDIFWRVTGVIFLLFIIVSPCWIIAFIISYKQPFQIADLAHSFFFLTVLLSMFVAMSYFPITEIIANDSKIGKSLKVAWSVFTYNFLILAFISLGLTLASYITSIIISMVTILVQYRFDFIVLSKLDFISPQLTIPDNNLFKLVIAINRAVWRTFGASIFTFAFLRYGGAKMRERSTP
ncbi:MAG: hypothetical protein ACM3XO_23660 [Bacteroidota bacterium]